MKKIYTFLFLLIAGMPVLAQQVIVEKSSGAETIEFSKLDKITFSGTTVSILQTDGSTTTAAMGDISRIYFSNYSNIGSIEAEFENGNMISYISNDNIAVNCSAGEIITIYNIIGSRIMCIRQQSDNGIISIAHLPKGIYIIKANNHTAKFVKR